MVDVAFRFRGNRRDARQLVQSVVDQLTGRQADSTGLARSVFLAIGFAALSDVQADFIVKSRGGTGADGVTWPPLSPEYLAYQRRFGPGEKAALKRAAGLGKGHRYGIGGKGGLLTKQQQVRWRQIYSRALTGLAARYDLPEAKAIAAGHAWSQLKAEGAKTMLEAYGRRQVEILRDTGVLFNSLSPGYLEGGESGATYIKPSADGGDQQIFLPLENGITVGTNVPYAAAHNEGDARRGIPARPFLPARVPDLWLRRWAGVAMQAIQLTMQRALQTAGGVG